MQIEGFFAIILPNEGERPGVCPPSSWHRVPGEGCLLNMSVIRRKKGLGCLTLLLAIGGLLVFGFWGEPNIPAFARMTQQTLVIDPGHGGEDGGAVSISGQQESQINLAIALELDQLMGFYGVPTVMTRSSDVSIHDAQASTLREKKVSDLHNRVDRINQVENATVISIHQNASPNTSFQGIQVFYGGDETLSRPLAQKVQETMIWALSPEKKRSVQRVDTSVYLMNHIACRAILVECGFLSNPEEDRLLQEPAYQRKLAMVLASSYLTSGSAQEGESFV